MKWNLFLKGDNKYNEIEFSLASIVVLNSKRTQNLSQLNANRCIIFLIMYELHFNWFKSYIYGIIFKDATYLTIVIFFNFEIIYEWVRDGVMI